MFNKTIPLISIILISILAFFLIYDSGSQNKDILKSTFEIDATYFDSGYVEISYLDTSNMTNKVVLEILGLDESFQKIFSGSQFVERVQIPVPSTYGWQIHPVTLLIDHNQLGKVSLKTEIHSFGQPAPPIIYGNP